MDDILFYTHLHTFDKYSVNVSNLLYNTLKYSLGNINFKIIIRYGDLEKYPEYIRPKMIESPFIDNYQFSGDLKYSNVIINEKYNRYVYIDSDILWFLKDNEFNKNQYCIEKSNYYDWFLYGYDFFEDSSLFLKSTKISDINLINSGFFSIDKKNFMLLSDFFKKRFDRDEVKSIKDITHQMRFEQSIFNMFINLNKNIYWEDLSDKIIMFAQENHAENKIYHFSGGLSMEEKFNRMKNFLIKNNLNL